MESDLCLSVLSFAQLKLDLTEQERDKAKEELKRKFHELEHLTLRAENESTRTGASASSLQQQVEESQDLVKVCSVLCCFPDYLCCIGALT